MREKVVERERRGGREKIFIFKNVKKNFIIKNLNKVSENFQYLIETIITKPSTFLNTLIQILNHPRKGFPDTIHQTPTQNNKKVNFF